MIPGITQALGSDDARRTDHFEQEVLGVAPRGRGQFGDERLQRERVRNVRDGTEPPDPYVRSLSGFSMRMFGMANGRSLSTDANFLRLLLGIRLERRHDRGRNRPVQPRAGSPFASTPPSRCWADTVWKSQCWIILPCPRP